MNARYVQKGESIDYRPTENTHAGSIIPLGNLVGIARLDIRAGELGALAVTGVFESPKGNEAIDVGDAVYWDTENEVATTTPTGIYLGKAIGNAQASSDFVNFLVNAPKGVGSGSGGSSDSETIADLDELTSDSGCAESMTTLREKINSILAALRSAGVIAS
ncbi:MAG: DUF2190 family protein [Lentisphaeria bacterium]|nr:DUF2190 family protein [Lentisphaeria bacterium]